MKALKDNFSK